MGKHPGGRPPKFKSVDEIAGKAEQYFMDCAGTLLMDEEGRPALDKWGEPVYLNRRPPTVTGLALAMGFSGRQQLLDYQSKREFADTITRAKARVEQYAEERLFDRDGQRGAEFSLRCNFRWKTDEDQSRENALSGGGVVLLPAVMQKPEPPEDEPDGEET